MLDYVIIGSGITGSCISCFLKDKTDSILVLDKNYKEDSNASTTAGGFISPILGKDNAFKSFVNRAFEFSTNFYTDNFTQYYDQCGVLRLPKDEKDVTKFKEYEQYIDIPYIKKDDGYFFASGGIVNTNLMLEKLREGIETKYNYDVKDLYFDTDVWIINNEIKTKNIILATGYQNILDELYLSIKGVFGERFDLKSSSVITHNYHKECSLSRSKDGILSIGATHNRDNFSKDINAYSSLLKKAKDITSFDAGDIVASYSGVRACTKDYFPIVGKIINSKKTLKKFPYLVNGTYVNEEKFEYYNNMYIINGVGGRGYVESPYLSKILIDFIFESKPIESRLTSSRLFIKGVRK